MNKRGMNKRGLELEMLGWWVIAVVVLIIVVVGIIILSGRAEGAIDFIKDLFRFKRT